MSVAWLLTLLLWQDFGSVLTARPVDYATATDVGADTVVVVTYAGEQPSRVCVGVYDVADGNYESPLNQHCFAPTNALGDFDVWKNQHLKDLGNILVTTTYRSGRTSVLTLFYRES